MPLLALTIFTLGATFFFAAANVYYRDVSHILQVVLSAWFYFTPIIYSLDFMPQQYRWLFKLNPLHVRHQRVSACRSTTVCCRVATSVAASFVCALCYARGLDSGYFANIRMSSYSMSELQTAFDAGVIRSGKRHPTFPGNPRASGHRARAIFQVLCATRPVITISMPSRMHHFRFPKARWSA